MTSNVLAGKKGRLFFRGWKRRKFLLINPIFAESRPSAPKGGLNFSTVPANLYAGGFHNFDSSGGTRIAMTVKTDAMAVQP